VSLVDLETSRGLQYFFCGGGEHWTSTKFLTQLLLNALKPVHCYSGCAHRPPPMLLAHTSIEGGVLTQIREHTMGIVQSPNAPVPTI